MLEAGVDKTYRDKILGHSMQGMDVHYIEKRIKDETLEKAMDIYTAWLDNQIETARAVASGLETAGAA
jgi:hypothetical protein